MLSQVLQDASVLLNDNNYSFTSKNQLTRWVNTARRQAAYRTGCVRRLISGQSAFGASSQPGMAVPGAMQPGMIPGVLTPGTLGTWATGAVQNTLQTIPQVERYPYQGFFNPYLRQTYAGCNEVLDSIELAVNWGGASRPVLDWKPWDEFQAYCRAYSVLNSSYPSVWTVYNDGPQGEIWMFPIPSQAGEIELDAFVSPKDIYSDDDVDVIPTMFHEALKFGAASLAFMSSRRYADAEIMEQKFSERIGVASVARDGGKSRSFYPIGV